ncbi:hypothetical protein FNV43_RR21401 [Rhamnella rubrinervis]|uniref:Uncharacterized protein n=1 Tax=Rhamnella rubrinervis TaxID=2594499 RepID=A0A8K0E0N4_9ROSA|nr:hypothetical protein FNV43_RR21401 [Rhamnella rubrinervis]
MRGCLVCCAGRRRGKLWMSEEVGSRSVGIFADGQREVGGGRGKLRVRGKLEVRGSSEAERTCSEYRRLPGERGCFGEGRMLGEVRSLLWSREEVGGKGVGSCGAPEEVAVGCGSWLRSEEVGRGQRRREREAWEGLRFAWKGRGKLPVNASWAGGQREAGASARVSGRAVSVAPRAVVSCGSGCGSWEAAGSCRTARGKPEAVRKLAEVRGLWEGCGSHFWPIRGCLRLEAARLCVWMVRRSWPKGQRIFADGREKWGGGQRKLARPKLWEAAGSQRRPKNLSGGRREACSENAGSFGVEAGGKWCRSCGSAEEVSRLWKLAEVRGSWLKSEKGGRAEAGEGREEIAWVRELPEILQPEEVAGRPPGSYRRAAGSLTASRSWRSREVKQVVREVMGVDVGVSGRGSLPEAVRKLSQAIGTGRTAIGSCRRM